VKESIPLLLIIGSLLALIIISGGVLVWLSPVTSEVLTPAQDTLIDTADWMIKSCAGAIVGFAGGVRLANGRAAPVSSG
jgi:hypothetical protein